MYLYLDFYVLFPLKISTYIDFRKNVVIQIFCQKNYYIYIHSWLLKANLWIRTLRIDSFPIAASSMQFRTCSARRSPDLWINNNLGKCVKSFFSLVITMIWVIAKICKHRVSPANKNLMKTTQEPFYAANQNYHSWLQGKIFTPMNPIFTWA